MSTSSQKSQLVAVLAADDGGDSVAGNQDDSVASAKEQRSSVVPECSEAEALSVDLESGGHKAKSVVEGKWERDCRICHLSMDEDDRGECGADNDPIELGCSCKDDLAAAHRQCAETWFKIRGNRTCEICGSIAQNVPGNDEAESSGVDEAPTLPPSIQTSGAPSFWQGHRFLNFVLACIIFAFVISWLFHFNVPS